jgi:hypothetical protein
MPSQGISGAPPRLSIEMEPTPQLNQSVRQIVGVGYLHEHLDRNCVRANQLRRKGL